MDTVFRGALVEATPILCQEDGVRWVGGIVFHAGRLPRHQPIERNSIFQSREILSRFVTYAGDRVTVANKLSVVFDRDRFASQPGTAVRFFLLPRQGRCGIDQFDDVAFHDPADLIHIRAAFSLGFVRIGRTAQPLRNHRARRNRCGSSDRGPDAPIKLLVLQRPALRAPASSRMSRRTSRAFS